MANFIGRLIETWSSQGTAPTPRRRTGRLLFASAGPKVLTITCLSLGAFQVKVTFSDPVLDNAALRAPENYLVTGPDLTIISVTPEPVLHPSYVVLETSEQVDGVAYTLAIQEIEAA